MAARGEIRHASCHPEKRYHSNGYCVQCAHRDVHLRLRYGIDLEDYEELLAAQKGRCAICGAFPIVKRLSVDHNHRTGTIRGLLCQACNGALGYLERPEWIRLAKQYLAA